MLFIKNFINKLMADVVVVEFVSTSSFHIIQIAMATLYVSDLIGVAL